MAADSRKQSQESPSARLEPARSTRIRWSLFGFVALLGALSAVWLSNTKGYPKSELAAEDQTLWNQNSQPAPQSSMCSPYTTKPKYVRFDAIGAGVCHLSGTVKDSHCDFASVEKVNRQHLLPLLSELVRKPFFRYFKVNLYCDCPFWPDDGMCSLRDCSVCECDNAEVPKSWLAADGVLPPSECGGIEQLEEEAAVDRRVDPGVQRRLQGIPGWRGMNNPWMPDDDKDVEFSYINLLENPERYTGYKGEHPNRIWKLIYSQSCFSDVDDLASCPEKRIFYRLISGMHSSISSHVVNEYLLDEARGEWGPNLAAFQERLGTEATKERIENLYFAFLFVLRAVLKAEPHLAGVSYDTGAAAEDARTATLIRELVQSQALKAACPVPFDEGRMWKTDDDGSLRQQLQRHFRNMTMAMDCVGCEKCKLWGKLQLLGIATSLKILFTSEGCSDGTRSTFGGRDPGGGAAQLELERNEVIALLNLLERLSKSIEIVRVLSARLSPHQRPPTHGAVEDITKQSLQQVI